MLGPNTPIVGCFEGRPFGSTSPRRILTNSSQFDLEGWRFEAVDGSRKLIGHVEPAREQVVGVTYHDPDGRPAYCYNSETASAGSRSKSAPAAAGGRRDARLRGALPLRVRDPDPDPGIELSVT